MTSTYRVSLNKVYKDVHREKKMRKIIDEAKKYIEETAQKEMNKGVRV